MLQRKQTLWALLAVLCAVATLKFPFYSGDLLAPAPGKLAQYLTAADSVLILIITVIIIIGGLVNIFNFKKHVLQFRITLLLILLSLLDIFLYYKEAQKFQNGTYSLTALFALAIPLLFFMATRGIWRDRQTLKNADRLR